MAEAQVRDENDMRAYDNAIGRIVDLWKDHKDVREIAKQMEVLGKNMFKLRGAKDAEARKMARIVWQKAAQQYWDLLWGIVEAKIDAGPPDELEFDPAERLFIDYGHLCSEYTTPNDAFFDYLAQPSSVDMYQYNRLTDYIRESYSLIFRKPYSGPEGGVTLEEKLNRFSAELKTTMSRRRMVVNALFSKFGLMERPELDEMLTNMERGLQDVTEVDMRTKRVREAEKEERERISENSRRYLVAEHAFSTALEALEHRLTDTEKKKNAAAAPAETASVPHTEENTHRSKIDSFDPFAEITDDFLEKKTEDDEAAAPDEPNAEKTPEAQREEAEPEPDEDLTESAESLSLKDGDNNADQTNGPDQSLKIIQNINALHDKTKFLASLIVHVTNEAQRWKTRAEMAAKKYKGQGVPALKMELREGINHKKDFMTLAARTGRVDTSPLCQNRTRPISMSRAGEIMMDLTPMDPDMLRASRIRMYGIPRVIIIPGQGLGVYDWEDNSLVIPMFGVVSDIKDFCFALGAFRWDNDEDRTLKDTYALLKTNKGKGIRATQEAFMNDYFLWLSKERKGYRILPREVAKWFKTFFKQRVGVLNPGKR
ncbi:MAG: hypothetical protein LBI74_01630 [Synergistaceae bacterium]|jgi:hypothetical protein|nr:hypothetical protein [Synergistaceae bacterium]